MNRKKKNQKNKKKTKKMFKFKLKANAVNKSHYKVFEIFFFLFLS